MGEVIRLGIDLERDFDPMHSIGMREACRLIRGRRGHLNVEVARRWANPKKGCRPRGKDGPVLVLPAVRVAGELRTMPAWVAAFERMRVRLGVRQPLAAAETPRPEGRRLAAFRAAEDRLDAAGIGGRRG